MIKKLLYYLSVTVVIITMAACSSSRRLGRTPTIGGLSGTDYMEKVINQTPQWQNITAKAALNLDMGTKGNAKVNATLRIRRGEVIRLSVAPLLGIEVARMDITPDNVLLIDRLNKRYVKVSFAELSRLANAELDFDVLQSLFMNELFLPGKAQLTANDVTKFRITSEGEQAVLEAKQGKYLSYRFVTETVNGLLENTRIGVKGTPYALSWMYGSFGRLDGKAFPQHMFITAGDDTKKVFSLDMKLSRLSVNDNWDAKTELSSKYKEIGLEELMKQLLKS